jgi:two-component system response regulator NreC
VSRTIRTLIVASTERLRHAYRDLLAGVPGFQIVALAAREEAPATARRHLPDLLIFALEPAEIGALSLLREIEAASPRTHVFFSTLPRREVETLTARRAAGRPAPDFASQLVEALRPAAPHRDGPPARPAPNVTSASDIGEDAEVHGSDALSSLTPREREVLRMAAEGLSSTETGRELGISARTAECHRAHGMRKLGLHRRADLVRFAMTAGLVGGRTDLR